IVVAVGGDSGSDGNDTKPTTSGSAIQKGSAGGFSASLSADLAKSGSGSETTAGSGSDAKGSDTAKPVMAGSDAKGSDAKGSDAKGSDTKVAISGSDAKGSDTKVAMSGSDAKGSDARGSDAKGSDTAKPAMAGSDTKAGSNAGSAAVKVETPHPPPVTPPAELAAIKLNMEPNWDRDSGEAGTISLSVKGSQKVFVFRYGMDDPKAPVDRDQYKKWLGDQHLLSVTLDRQRGAAWYLEGTNGDGAPAFRYLVNYGGKHLICGGLLYKDPESNKLGDIRDRVIIQAKQICESMTL
ncbi:MAG TPA: hypothetical protein VGO00_11335, partial [Kofleriaceae bacterium]|nr:hypothetical protein [Kofleriaceae bacterium]